MEHLGGSIVRDARDGERECYRLTFLGVLLTANGAAIELLLVRYLEWLKGRRRTHANLTSISPDDVTVGLSITPAETAALWRVLEVAEWRAGPALRAVRAAPALGALVEPLARGAYG